MAERLKSDGNASSSQWVPRSLPEASLFLDACSYNAVKLHLKQAVRFLAACLHRVDHHSGKDRRTGTFLLRCGGILREFQHRSAGEGRYAELYLCCEVKVWLCAGFHIACHQCQLLFLHADRFPAASLYSADQYRGKERRTWPLISARPASAYQYESEEYDVNNCLSDSGYKTDVGNF